MLVKKLISASQYGVSFDIDATTFCSGRIFIIIGKPCNVGSEPRYFLWQPIAYRLNTKPLALVKSFTVDNQAVPGFAVRIDVS